MDLGPESTGASACLFGALKVDADAAVRDGRILEHGFEGNGSATHARLDGRGLARAQVDRRDSSGTTPLESRSFQNL
jgi:hypothetical protein